MRTDSCSSATTFPAEGRHESVVTDVPWSVGRISSPHPKHERNVALRCWVRRAAGQEDEALERHFFAWRTTTVSFYQHHIVPYLVHLSMRARTPTFGCIRMTPKGRLPLIGRQVILS